LHFDCIVVGAGFAGLSAADALVREGQRVCVVEARDRVGGRVATIHLADGTPLDIGGQWIGPTHDRMYALCRRYGAEVYPMYVGGKNLLLLGGKRRTYRGHIPVRAPLAALANVGLSLVKLQMLARKVPLEAPWEAPNAAELDQQTLGDWIRKNVRNRDAAAMTHIGVESVFAAQADEISLLHALFYMRSGNSFDFLTRSQGGAQQDRITGGIQALAEGLAADVSNGGEVMLEAPVERIVQDGEGVEVHTAKGSVRGDRVIVTLPPPLAGGIDYAPGLSAEREALLARVPMGAVIKCVAAYPTAFWREDGWSGATVCDQPPINVTFDASPKSGSPGLLLAFIEGPHAREMAGWDPADRRTLVLDAFVRSFGETAGNPTEYLDRAWTEEPFSRGCYAALFPPGVWTSLGFTIRRPEGRIHWAGTETATRWNGYIEGAVLSGERAAAEVLANLT